MHAPSLETHACCDRASGHSELPNRSELQNRSELHFTCTFHGEPPHDLFIFSSKIQSFAAIGVATLFLGRKTRHSEKHVIPNRTVFVSHIRMAPFKNDVALCVAFVQCCCGAARSCMLSRRTWALVEEIRAISIEKLWKLPLFPVIFEKPRGIAGWSGDSPRYHLYYAYCNNIINSYYYKHAIDQKMHDDILNWPEIPQEMILK
jgi:hypothetical protein